MIDHHSYHHSFINLNNREVKVSAILSDTIIPQSVFEQHTVEFIREWLTGKEKFTLSTSGSTGSPKIIEITREQMMYSARTTIKALHLRTGDTALACLNTQFIGGIMMLVRAFVGHMKIVAYDPTSNPLQHNVQAFDFIALVPLQLKAILNSEIKNQLNGAKAILVGGAPIDVALIESIQTIPAPVFATYGMTETVSHIALRKLNGQTVEHVYTTLPEIKIETDKRGCLVINAPYLQEKVYTNDLVELHGNKKFTWMGRWDNIINTGGIKVSTEKIESDIQHIMKASNVSQNFLISSVPDAALGEKIIIIIEGIPHQNWDKILIHHKQTISKYEAPKEIYSLKNFIYTKGEKIDRKATLQACMAQNFRGYNAQGQ